MRDSRERTPGPGVLIGALVLNLKAGSEAGEDLYVVVRYRASWWVEIRGHVSKCTPG